MPHWNRAALPAQLSLSKVAVITFLTLGVWGCRTTSPPSDNSGNVTSGEKAMGQILSTDLMVEQNSKSYKLRSEIYIVDEKAIRLDLRTSLDYPLASVVFTDDKIEYLLYRDKKYFTGKPNPHALDPLFPLTVNVGELVDIMLERKNIHQRCESDQRGLVRCEGAAGPTAYTVNWSKRDSTGPLSGRASKIVLELPQRHVSLKFYITDWQRKLTNAQRFLVLQVPRDFRTYSVPVH